MIQHQQVTNLVLKNYQFYELLGQGTSARVYRAYNNTHHQNYAIKVIPKQYLNSDKKLFELVKTQIQILKSCNNINVIKCYEVFHTKNSIFIVTQLCKSNNMQQYLKEIKFVAQDQAVMYLKQILNGFKGLHAIGVMHRDFKLANVLINNGLCKIADLGYAKKMKLNQLTYTRIGTKITMAPQVIQGQGYGFNADIWSLGVVFYKMLYGKYPYIAQNQFGLLKLIKAKNVDFSQRKISPQAKHFIQHCLVYNPKNRLTWQQVYKHPIINKPTFQILYSIHNLLPILQKNNEFYQKNQNIQPSPQLSFLSQLSQQSKYSTQTQSIILRKSGRKQLIMEEICSIFYKKMETIGNDNPFDMNTESINTQKYKEIQQILYSYAEHYIRYFNQLANVFKFIRIQLLTGWTQQINSYILQQSLKNSTPLQIQSLLYLILKKSYSQLTQYQKILKNKINIFKISKLWQQYLQSSYYKTITQTIISNIDKCLKILKKLQQPACLSTIQQISMQACQQQYQCFQYPKIQYLCQKYVRNGIYSLYMFWKDREIVQEDFGDFMEGLLYYLVQDQREKIMPEQFDKIIERFVDYGKGRKDLVERYQIFFSYM